MTSKNTILRVLPLTVALLAALAGCGGSDFVDPGVQTAQVDTSTSATSTPPTEGFGTAIPVPELQADAGDIAAAAAAAAAAETAAPPVPSTELAPGFVDATANATANATTPAPDCAAEGCSGLRIIDGNAEAYRADAQVRENREQAQAY